MALKIEVGDLCAMFSALLFSLLCRSANQRGGNGSVPCNKHKLHNVSTLIEILIKGKLVKKGTCQMFEDEVFMHYFNLMSSFKYTSTICFILKIGTKSMSLFFHL